MHHLLQADDDVVFCKVLCRALRKCGYAVTVLLCVEEAMPIVTDNPQEYAVGDLKMKGSSGLALIQALHELDPATRIVVLTGYARHHHSSRGYQAGRNSISHQTCKSLLRSCIFQALTYKPIFNSPLWIVLNGNTSATYYISKEEIFPPLHAPSACIGVPCNVSCRSRQICKTLVSHLLAPLNLYLAI